LGVVVILCAASITLARWQNVPPQGKLGRHENDNMSGGWAAGHAYWQKQESIRTVGRQGEQAAANGHYAEGEILFWKALVVYPHSPESLLGLADACAGKGKQAEALKAYQALIYARGWGSSINSDPTTSMRYVLALSRIGRWQEALDVYDKANQRTLSGTGKPIAPVSFTRGTPSWTELKAAAHLALGMRRPSYGPADLRAQLAHLETAARPQPNWAAAQFAYGQALEKAGRVKEAKSAYEKALTRADPKLKGRAEGELRKLNMRR